MLIVVNLLILRVKHVPSFNGWTLMLKMTLMLRWSINVEGLNEVYESREETSVNYVTQKIFPLLLTFFYGI